MKKIRLFITLALIISILLMSIVVLAKDNIKVFIDGAEVLFDVLPTTVNDRTMVPLRAIFEVLGAEVDWNDTTQTVVSTKDNIQIALTINDKTMYVNGTPKTLDVAAMLKDGRTFVPIRAISEAFCCDVQWDDASHVVNIFTSKSVSPRQGAIEKLRNWISNNYNYTIPGNEGYIGFEQESGLLRFTVSPVINSSDVVISYSNMTLNENINLSVYLSNAQYNGGYFINGTRSVLKGNIIKSTLPNKFDLTCTFYESDYEGNREVILKKFDSIANDVLIMFDSFLKENNVGLTLKDFGLDYNMSNTSVVQETAFNNLRDFIIAYQNDTINDKPVFVQASDDSNGSTQYSIQYNDKNDTIKLTMRKIYNDAWIYSYTTLTRTDQKYHCSFSFYNPSNKSNTPDFDAAYTIDANNFGENTNISFKNISGDMSGVNLYKDLAKLMNLEMLNYTDFIFENFMQFSNCSMKDFGFNLK